MLKLKGGYAFKSEKFQDSGVPVVRISNLPQNSYSVDLSDCVYYECGNYQNYTVKNGDLLIAMSGATTGKTAIYRYDYPAYLNQRVGLFAPKELVHNQFLYPIVESKTFISQLGSKLVAGAQPNISSQDIETIAVGLPSKEEQIKIAHLFELLNQKIETQSKIIEELTTLRSALIEKCAKQSGNFFSLSDILKEVEERSTTANQHQVLSSTVKGIFSQKEYFNKDIASEDNKGYKVVRKGHIVLSPQNLWMGNINYNDRFDIGIVSPSYKVFSIKEGFNPIFIAALLQTKKALNEYMLASEQGASIVRRNLNIEAFMAIKFRIPDARQQDSLSMAITAINAKLNNERCYLEQLTMQKSCLLENMFI